MNKPCSIETLKESLAAYIDCGYNLQEAANRLGLPRTTVQCRLQTAKQKGLWDGVKKQAPRDEGLEIDIGDNNGTVVTRSSSIRTLEQALKAAKVDQRVWRVERHVINKWEMGAKDPQGRVTVQELWQVKIWLARRVRNDAELLSKAIMDQIAEIGRSRHANRTVNANKSDFVLEMSLPDLHIGKFAWRPESGDNYDSSRAVAVYEGAVADLLLKAKPYNIGRIIMPIGNDLVHVDNAEGTTTSGTHVDSDSRWQKMFAVAKTMLISSIDIAAKIAPVEVIIIPGNHDRQSSFAMGEVISAWYRHSKCVKVDNSAPERKYRQIGKCLLGFTHGDRVRLDHLPLVMAKEAKDQYSKCEHYVWHYGHFHKAREHKHTAGDTHGGVSLECIPSLSGTDAWHFQNGFVDGIKAAVAFVWNPDKGLEARLHHYPDNANYH